MTGVEEVPLLRRLGAAQKSARGVSLYSRLVNRPVGRVLAAGAVRVGASAQAVTYLSAAVTVAGCALLVLAPPTGLLGVLVALTLALGFALDSADGQVARLTGTGSPAGEWTDHVVDAAKMVLVPTAVLIAWFRWDLVPSDAWLLVPLAAQLIATTMFAGGTLADLVARAAPTVTAQPDRAPSRVRAIALLPADYGVLCLTFTLWGAPGVFRTAYAALVAVNLLILVLLLRRWYGGLRRAGAVAST